MTGFTMLSGQSTEMQREKEMLCNLSLQKQETKAEVVWLLRPKCTIFPGAKEIALSQTRYPGELEYFALSESTHYQRKRLWRQSET